MLSVTEPNNTPGTAVFVPDIYLQHQYFATDAVSEAEDRDDYFGFYTLLGPSQLYASLYGLTSDADLYIYKGNDVLNHVLVASSTAGGNISETIQIDLDGHSYYYVRVFGYSGNTDYSLLLINDYAGSSTATALDLGTAWGQSSSSFWPQDQTHYYDYMDFRDNVDYVKFEMEAPGTINVRRIQVPDTPNMLQTTTQLLDAGGNVLANGYNSDRAQIIDRYAVPRGTYFVKFTQIAGAGDYSYRIVADYGGDTTATARDLGNLAGTSRQMFDMVGGIDSGVASYNDSVDIYRFTFAETAPLDIGLTMRPAFDAPTWDANLRLARDTDGNGFISAGETILASASAGNDRISTTLTPGVYYVLVDKNTNYPSYQLDLDSDFDAIASAPQPWLEMSQARSAGDLAGESYFIDGFGTSAGDFRDTYSFQMEAPGTLLASAQINPFYSRTAQPPVLYVIRDENGNLRHDPGEELNPDGGEGLVRMALPAGSYFLGAVGTGQQAEYQLRFVPDYAGNTLADARPFAAVDLQAIVTQTFHDYIEQFFDASSDVDDYYRFSLAGTSVATFATDGVAGEDLSLALIHDTNGNGQIDAAEVLHSSDVPDSPTESLSRSLDVGTYFIRISGVNGATNYTLSADFSPSAALAGDFNGNGLVDQADLDFVLLNWGQNPGIGIIDQGELDAVLLNWGRAEVNETVAARTAQLMPKRDVGVNQELGNARSRPADSSLTKRSHLPPNSDWATTIDGIFANNDDWLFPRINGLASRYTKIS